jgi:hypothetical protein
MKMEAKYFSETSVNFHRLHVSQKIGHLVLSEVRKRKYVKCYAVLYETRGGIAQAMQ